MMRPREAGVTAAGVTVAGVTEAGVTALPDHVRQRIAEADCIIAASRFHADLPDGKEILDWPTPFSNIFNLLDDLSDKSLVLLTTGDPMLSR